MNDAIQNMLLDLKARQLAGGHMPCPRCGRDVMKDRIHTNFVDVAVQRYVHYHEGTNEDVYLLRDGKRFTLSKIAGAEKGADDGK